MFQEFLSPQDPLQILTANENKQTNRQKQILTAGTVKRHVGKLDFLLPDTNSHKYTRVSALPSLSLICHPPPS